MPDSWEDAQRRVQEKFSDPYSIPNGPVNEPPSESDESKEDKRADDAKRASAPPEPGKVVLRAAGLSDAGRARLAAQTQGAFDEVRQSGIDVDFWKLALTPGAFALEWFLGAKKKTEEKAREAGAWIGALKKRGWLGDLPVELTVVLKETNRWSPITLWTLQLGEIGAAALLKGANKIAEDSAFTRLARRSAIQLGEALAAETRPQALSMKEDKASRNEKEQGKKLMKLTDTLITLSIDNADGEAPKPLRVIRKWVGLGGEYHEAMEKQGLSEAERSRMAFCHELSHCLHYGFMEKTSAQMSEVMLGSSVLDPRQNMIWNAMFGARFESNPSAKGDALMKERGPDALNWLNLVIWSKDWNAPSASALSPERIKEEVADMMGVVLWAQSVPGSDWKKALAALLNARAVDDQVNPMDWRPHNTSSALALLEKGRREKGWDIAEWSPKEVLEKTHDLVMQNKARSIQELAGDMGGLAFLANSCLKEARSLDQETHENSAGIEALMNRCAKKAGGNPRPWGLWTPEQKRVGALLWMSDKMSPLDQESHSLARKIGEGFLIGLPNARLARVWPALARSERRHFRDADGTRVEWVKEMGFKQIDVLERLFTRLENTVEKEEANPGTVFKKVKGIEFR